MMYTSINHQVFLISDSRLDILTWLRKRSSTIGIDWWEDTWHPTPTQTVDWKFCRTTQEVVIVFTDWTDWADEVNN